jgi:hypothetical protein
MGDEPSVGTTPCSKIWRASIGFLLKRLDGENMVYKPADNRDGVKRSQRLRIVR